MATFEATIQSKRKDKTYLVYIRVLQKSKPSYIRTDMYVHENKVIDKTITDKRILSRCHVIIGEYIDKINKVDSRNWSVKDVVEYLQMDNENIDFYAFCEEYVNSMRSEGRYISANNYKSAVNSFRKSFGNTVSFRDIDSYKLTKWIKTLQNTKRSKESYPKAIKAIFDAGLLKYNNYNTNIIRIPTLPFKTVNIPKHDTPDKRAVDVEIIRKLANYSPTSKQEDMAISVLKLMIYFAGINTVDIYKMTLDQIKDKKLIYTRSKTKHRSGSKPKMRISVRPEIQELMTKYNDKNKVWGKWNYSTSTDFNRYVNRALKRICDKLGLPKVTTYSFRHTWATIAQIKLGASDELIGECFTHQSKSKEAAGYIDKDYQRVEKLNNKVIDYIFGLSQKNKSVKKVR